MHRGGDSGDDDDIDKMGDDEIDHDYDKMDDDDDDIDKIGDDEIVHIALTDGRNGGIVEAQQFP